jgi:hypothetical protein
VVIFVTRPLIREPITGINMVLYGININLLLDREEKYEICNDDGKSLKKNGCVGGVIEVLNI